MADELVLPELSGGPGADTKEPKRPRVDPVDAFIKENNLVAYGVDEEVGNRLKVLLDEFCRPETDKKRRAEIMAELVRRQDELRIPPGQVSLLTLPFAVPRDYRYAPPKPAAAAPSVGAIEVRPRPGGVVADGLESVHTEFVRQIELAPESGGATAVAGGGGGRRGGGGGGRPPEVPPPAEPPPQPPEAPPLAEPPEGQPWERRDFFRPGGGFWQPGEIETFEQAATLIRGKVYKSAVRPGGVTGPFQFADRNILGQWIDRAEQLAREGATADPELGDLPVEQRIEVLRRKFVQLDKFQKAMLHAGEFWFDAWKHEQGIGAGWKRMVAMGPRFTPKDAVEVLSDPWAVRGFHRRHQDYGGFARNWDEGPSAEFAHAGMIYGHWLQRFTGDTPYGYEMEWKPVKDPEGKIIKIFKPLTRETVVMRNGRQVKETAMVYEMKNGQPVARGEYVAYMAPFVKQVGEDYEEMRNTQTYYYMQESYGPIYEGKYLFLEPVYLRDPQTGDVVFGEEGEPLIANYINHADAVFWDYWHSPNMLSFYTDEGNWEMVRDSVSLAKGKTNKELTGWEDEWVYEDPSTYDPDNPGRLRVLKTTKVKRFHELRKTIADYEKNPGNYIDESLVKNQREAGRLSRTLSMIMTGWSDAEIEEYWLLCDGSDEVVGTDELAKEIEELELAEREPGKTEAELLAISKERGEKSTDYIRRLERIFALENTPREMPRLEQMSPQDRQRELERRWTIQDKLNAKYFWLEKLPRQSWLRNERMAMLYDEYTRLMAEMLMGTREQWQQNERGGLLALDIHALAPERFRTNADYQVLNPRTGQYEGLHYFLDFSSERWKSRWKFDDLNTITDWAQNQDYAQVTARALILQFSGPGIEVPKMIEFAQQISSEYGYRHLGKTHFAEIREFKTAHFFDLISSVLHTAAQARRNQGERFSLFDDMRKWKHFGFDRTFDRNYDFLPCDILNKDWRSIRSSGDLEPEQKLRLVVNRINTPDHWEKGVLANWSADGLRDGRIRTPINFEDLLAYLGLRVEPFINPHTGETSDYYYTKETVGVYVDEQGQGRPKMLEVRRCDIAKDKGGVWRRQRYESQDAERELREKFAIIDENMSNIYTTWYNFLSIGDRDYLIRWEVIDNGYLGNTFDKDPNTWIEKRWGEPRNHWRRLGGDIWYKKDEKPREGFYNITAFQQFALGPGKGQYIGATIKIAWDGSLRADENGKWRVVLNNDDQPVLNLGERGDGLQPVTGSNELGGTARVLRQVPAGRDRFRRELDGTTIHYAGFGYRLTPGELFFQDVYYARQYFPLFSAAFWKEAAENLPTIFISVLKTKLHRFGMTPQKINKILNRLGTIGEALIDPDKVQNLKAEWGSTEEKTAAFVERLDEMHTPNTEGQIIPSLYGKDMEQALGLIQETAPGVAGGIVARIGQMFGFRKQEERMAQIRGVAYASILPGLAVALWRAVQPAVFFDPSLAITAVSLFPWVSWLPAIFLSKDTETGADEPRGILRRFVHYGIPAFRKVPVLNKIPFAKDIHLGGWGIGRRKREKSDLEYLVNGLDGVHDDGVPEESVANIFIQGKQLFGKQARRMLGS